MRKQDKEFIDLVRRHLKSTGKKLRFLNAKHSNGSVGFFNKDGIIVVKKIPIFKLMPVISHEYVHFLHSLKGTWEHLSPKYWDIVNSYNLSDGGVLWNKTPLRERIRACKGVQRCEHSVEKQSFSLIKKFNLSHREAAVITSINLNTMHYSVLPFMKAQLWKRQIGESQELRNIVPSNKILSLREMQKPPKCFQQKIEDWVF